MSDIKRARHLILTLSLIIPLISFALAESECLSPTTLYMGSGPVQPCEIQQVSIPVYMNNPCAVGGFEIHITPSDRSWIWFSNGDSTVVDTFGSRLSNWDLFLSIVSSDSSEVSIVGIADLPGGHSNSQLPPGDGLIFTIHLTTSVYTQSDTGLPVMVSFANISDTSGYILYDVSLQPGHVDVGASLCDSNPRGDCNCDGTRNGIDVVYLVNYLKSIGQLNICGGCAGDANNTGNVNGIDVTYLVNYLKGFGPTPTPCD